MKRTVWICDRCGTDHYIAWYVVTVNPGKGLCADTRERSLELCGLCASHLREFLDGDAGEADG